MPTNVVEYHVNGLATLQAYGVLTEGTWSNIGYSRDGIDIKLTYHSDHVISDKWGSQLPSDILDLGQEAEITLELTKYDTEALAALQGRLNEPDVNPGVYPNVSSAGSTNLIGTLHGQCGLMQPIAILRGGNVGCEQEEEGGWQFDNAYLSGTDAFKVGTKVTIHNLTFSAYPNASGVLYTVLGSSNTPSTPHPGFQG